MIAKSGPLGGWPTFPGFGKGGIPLAVLHEILGLDPQG